MTKANRPDRTGFEIWNSLGCGVVHLKAGGVRLDLETAEFESITQAVASIYCGDRLANGLQVDRSKPLGMDKFLGGLAYDEAH